MDGGPRRHWLRDDGCGGGGRSYILVLELARAPHANTYNNTRIKSSLAPHTPVSHINMLPSQGIYCDWF